ncbi:MAG: hypothetical protein E7673_05020 [Ruminococcaceae bacterium]|nr:hypothetical protein [Oscillospiraceae bacterium]
MQNDCHSFASQSNPLTYNNGSAYTFIPSGRDLVGAFYNSNTYSFTYNENGYRTSKTKNGVTTTYYCILNFLISLMQK